MCGRYKTLSHKNELIIRLRSDTSHTSIVLVLLFCASWSINLPNLEAAPQGQELFTPNLPGDVIDPDTAQLVHLDDAENVYFDIYVIRGQENKIMYAKNCVLVVSIQSPEQVHETYEKGLWQFMTSLLGVDQSHIEILMFPFDAGRRVILKKGKLTMDECSSKIKDVLQPYIPSRGQSPGQTEPPPLITPYDPLAVYAQNTTNDKRGPFKYYEFTVPKEEKSEKRSEPIPRKRLVEMKPFYSKDPTWMGRILKDLRPNKEVVLRGRLVPGMPLRPLLDDYRGPNKVKLNRKILQGIVDGSSLPKPKTPMRLEMSHAVPATMMLDYLSPDKNAIVSRRVISPLFRNETFDLVEEFEYTEVV